MRENFLLCDIKHADIHSVNMKNTQLIFVHSLFYPDHSAGSQMLTDLSFYLADKGMIVSVITSRQTYDGIGVLLPPYEEINKVKVYRAWSTNFGRGTFFGRVFDYLSLEISLIIKLFKMTKKDNIVVLMTDPPLLNIIACPIITFKGGKVVNWLQDLFPEVAVGAGVIKKSSLINKVITRFRNRSLNKAEYNIVIGHRMHDYLTSVGIDRGKVVRIPNWADGSAIKPQDRDSNHIREKWGLKDKFVVGYSGNLGKAHDVSTFLRAIEKLQYNTDICFLFIGGGVGMRKLEEYVNQKHLDNVMFQPYQPRNLLHLTLSVADVHWVTLEAQMEGYIVPSKIYGILSAGRPIIFIGNENGELSKEVNQMKCGIGVDVGDDKKLVEIIERYSTDIKAIQKMGGRGREAFEELYDLPISANKFFNLFGEIDSSTNIETVFKAD